MIKSKLTLKEIAQTLNVSPSTVSIVLHNKSGVSDATREKVMHLLKTNGYLEKPKIKDIHLLKYHTSNYHTGRNDSFITTIIDSIGLEARKLEINVKITLCHEGEFQKVLAMLQSTPLDGMILLGTDLPLIYETYFDGYGSPIILVDTHLPLCNLDSVVIDNEQCIYTALQHLFDIGHRQIGLIHSCFETFNSVQRRDSYFSYLRSHNLSVNKDHIFSVNPQLEKSYSNVVSILRESGSMPSAIIVDSDMIAMGMIKAFKNEGFMVPDDISVVGIGDSLFSRMADPQLTAIRIPADYIGRIAIRTLHQRIFSRNLPVVKTSISGEFICRQSTAPIL